DGGASEIAGAPCTDVPGGQRSGDRDQTGFPVRIGADVPDAGGRIAGKTAGGADDGGGVRTSADPRAEEAGNDRGVSGGDQTVAKNQTTIQTKAGRGPSCAFPHESGIYGEAQSGRVAELRNIRVPG